MDLRQLNDSYKTQYNKLVTHVIQSWEWGQFRQSLGTPVLRYGLFKNGRLNKAFQLTLHKIPLTNQFVGYLPKGPVPDKELAEALEQIGQRVFISEGKKLCFIKVEPNILSTGFPFSVYPKFLPSPRQMFTKHNLIIDLTLPEEKLLANMHPKTRYNIKVAQRHQVVVEERVDQQALNIYLKLYFATTKRQDYFGHNPTYHRQVWQTLKDAGMARLLLAFYQKSASRRRIPLACWMLLNFKDTLYYPYGGSSTLHKEMMASNLVAWEAIRLGQRLHLKKFDLWGALGENPNPHHPHYGFHNFKAGFGGQLVEYVGSYDLVFNDTLYYTVSLIDQFTKLKALLLKLLG